MEIDDYNMKFKRKRSYGPNQKKIDDSNLMHALKSGLECTRTLKQESDFNVFKKGNALFEIFKLGANYVILNIVSIIL